MQRDLLKGKSEPGLVAYTCNPNIREAEAGGLPQIQDQAGLQSEFDISLDYMVRLFQKTKKR